MDFGQLIISIRQTHENLKAQSSRAINIALALRNWLIGYHIAEYELNGADRAAYGERIVPELANQLKDISNCSKRQLYRYLRFYRVYPDVVRALPAQFRRFLPEQAPAEKVGTVSPLSYSILEKLSYSHLELLLDLDDDLKRRFYELECMRGAWSVRELQRQIASLAYERAVLSRDKAEFIRRLEQNPAPHDAAAVIRDPYVFEFLGLTPQEVMSESAVEEQLIVKLEDFLLELGNGFCFEARQKRILIGDEFFFVDLVFYHRILKCHVLVELKLEQFTHENIGQLNTYVSWYKKNMMSAGDNPPIGILLCTSKNQALVEYALAGMGNDLFVSKYLLELPSKEDMQAFIEQQVETFEKEKDLQG